MLQAQPFPYVAAFISPLGAARTADGALIAVGLPATFTVFGKFGDGSAQVPSPEVLAGLTWALQPADPTAQLRVHDGLLELTMTHTGSVQLRVEGKTIDGFSVQATLVVQAKAVTGALQLRAVSVQRGPWFAPERSFALAAFDRLFNSFDSSSGPPPAAVAPINGEVLVVGEVTATLEGGAGTRSVIDPTLLQYSATSGSMRGDGHLTSPSPTTSTITVTYGGATTTAQASFVTAQPATALSLADEAPVASVANGKGLVESTASVGSVTLESVLAMNRSEVPTLGFIPSRAGTSKRAWLLVRHGTSAPFFEWLALTDVARSMLAPPEVTLQGNGVVQLDSSGFGLQVLTAQGLSMPLLIRAPYAFGVASSLRTDQPQLSLQAPTKTQTGECRDLSLWVTPPGGSEHQLSALESFGLDLDPALTFMPLLDATRSRGAHWCAASTMTSQRTQTVTVYFLGAHTTVELTVPK